MLKERQCKRRIYGCESRQRNTSPLIIWCCGRGSERQQGFRSSLWQQKGPEGTWLFWSRAEGLELSKEYRDAQQIVCFLVNLGRASRFKVLFCCCCCSLSSSKSVLEYDPGDIYPLAFLWARVIHRGPSHQNQVTNPSVGAWLCSKMSHCDIPVALHKLIQVFGSTCLV